MTLNLIESVNSILSEVEDKSNKPIEFIEKEDLKTYAVVKIARSSMPAHLIFYKKDHAELINHLIAHECGHILRTFGVPEAKRLIPMSYKDNRDRVIKDISKDLKKLSSVVPAQKVDQLVDFWHRGIVQQITSYPPDISIEKWIYDSYPELRPYQLESIEKQKESSIAVLSNEVKMMVPRKIYNANNLMNYAFFNILGEHIGVDLVKPYNRTPYVKKGKKLVSLTKKEFVNTYEGDIEMTNHWAKFLNISGWFEWTSFENIPDNYLTSV